MNIFYRISDTGYTKVKPYYINNEKCFRNFCETFSNHICNIQVLADNVSMQTRLMLEEYVDPSQITHVKVGNGAGTFNLVLDRALKCGDEEICYFVENDYLHKPDSATVLQEGFNLGASFVSLYDHPDKYLDPSKGGNPFCEGGGEETRVYLTKTCHWKLTNSTTMTFAATVNTLKRTEPILRKWTNTSHPDDFKMFLELREVGETLITPIPGFSTHGESVWLGPLVN